jgi:hypothetical protein
MGGMGLENIDSIGAAIGIANSSSAFQVLYQ